MGEEGGRGEVQRRARGGRGEGRQVRVGAKEWGKKRVGVGGGAGWGGGEGGGRQVRVGEEDEGKKRRWGGGREKQVVVGGIGDEVLGS